MFIEFLKGDRFADIDVYNDGDLVLSTGGMNDRPGAWDVSKLGAAESSRRSKSTCSERRPVDFDDPEELLHRRLHPNDAPDGELRWDAAFRWASDRAEDGLSIDRGRLTGDNPRRYLPAPSESYGVASFKVGDIGAEDTADNPQFVLVYTPIDADAASGRTANPAHSEVRISVSGVVVSNPGKFCKHGVAKFRTLMKTLKMRGRLDLHLPPPSDDR